MIKIKFSKLACNYQNRKYSFQRIFLNHLMKSKQIKVYKSSKGNKRSSETDTQYKKAKIIIQKYDQEYLLPMHIKIPKNKISKNKNQLHKNSKILQQCEQKTTKRKQKKYLSQEYNATSIHNYNIQLIETIKNDKSLLKLKSKATQKTYRNSSKNNNTSSQFTDQITSPKGQSKLNLNRKKNFESKIQMNLPQQEYLFIGDQFFLINNYYPTKRLLNTFRDVCIQQNIDSKFIMQDKFDKVGKQRLEIKRTNIFTQARKQIEMKSKIQKIILIQKWWRKMMHKYNLCDQKSNPQILQIDDVSPVKYTFQSYDQIDTITPIKPYLEERVKQQVIKPQKENEIEIISFNSVEILQDEKPKKIEFKQEDISKMLMGSYRLPQTCQVDHTENQAIFTNYSKFKGHEPEEHAHSESEDSSQNLLSPKKDDVYPRQTTKQSFLECDRQHNFDLLQQFQEAAKIKQLIDMRIIEQKGQNKSIEKFHIGISTSILSIHNLLVNFFQYYINRHKDQFLSLINMPYGYSINSRLKALSGNPLPLTIQEDDCGILYGLNQIIDDDKIEEYFKFVEIRDGKMANSYSKANFELQKIHFKSIADYFNQELNQYRPYRQINGIPYPWNNSYKALTFYFVTQENIAEVFQKAEMKILKATSLLCGIIIAESDSNRKYEKKLTADQFMQNYQKKNGMILEHNEARQVRLLHQQIKNEYFLPDFQNFSQILLQIANQITNSLAVQSVQQLSQILGKFIY